MKKIVLTGGGTAGHVTPNIALIEQLSNSCQLHYIGTSGMESALIAPFVKNGNIIYHTITAHKLKRKLCMGNFLLPMRLIKSINEATKILREIQPDLIFSKGGYVALPVVIAGHKLKIDCVMHESDITLGLANKLSAPFCKKVFTAFPSTKCKNKQYVGTLIRKNIKEGNRSKGLQFMNFDGSKPILLVFGGSLGAKTLNNTIIQCQELSEKFDIFVLTGKNKRVDSKILHQAEY
ncbi:MAG: glycosyltransferase, partial [Clostridia bacterium]